MGSGFKDFAAGDILTAADVDGYLMRQTVMTFADASARDTALSGVLDEGMVAYLEDTNAVTVYNGSAWVAVIDSDVLTVDTANNRVGINDSTPSYALDVTGDVNASGDLRIAGETVGDVTTWSATATVQSGSGFTYSVPVAWHATIKDMIVGNFRIDITGGTSLSDMRVTMPVNGGNDQLAGVAREIGLTGNLYQLSTLSNEFIFRVGASAAVSNGAIFLCQFQYVRS